MVEDLSLYEGMLIYPEFNNINKSKLIEVNIMQKWQYFA